MRGDLQIISIPPGVNRQGTEYETKGRWRDCDRIRFHQGLVQPVGDRRSSGMSPVSGRPCGAHAWFSNDLGRVLVMGTHDGLYVTLSDLGGAWSDIAPADLSPGREHGSGADGYGIGLYDSETYGTPRTAHDDTTGRVLAAANWAIDNRGQEMFALLPADGRILTWTPPDTATKAAVLENAPTANWFVVTPHQHIMALGGDDPRKIAWSDNVDTTIWTPDTTNQAGFLQLQDDSGPISACRYRQSVMVWTANHLHELRPVGFPYWWVATKIGRNCGISNSRAWVTDGHIIAWMGDDGFWFYDGVRVQPLASEVHDYVFSGQNLLQRSKIHAAHVPAYSEFTWFYAAGNSTEIDRYVTWNYQENHWAIGSWDVTVYQTPGAYDYPIGWTADGNTWVHEQDYRAQAYIESSAIEIGNGDRLQRLHYLVPDFSGANCQWTIRGQDNPQSSSRVIANQACLSSRGRIDIRGQARQIAVKIEATQAGRWELGLSRLSMTAGGRRT